MIRISKELMEKATEIGKKEFLKLATLFRKAMDKYIRDYDGQEILLKKARELEKQGELV